MITVDGLTVEFGGTTLFKDISFQINAYNGKPRSFLPGFPSTKSRKITCCFRSSDFLLYRKSYMRTGKKSGTRHSHPLPWCSAKSCLLKS